MIKKTFSHLKKLIYTIYYSYIRRDNVLFARKLGVSIGSGCKILANPISVFGTEPWLIRIGNNVEITGSVSFVNHDGAVWLARHLYDEYKDADIFGSIVVGDNVFIGIRTIILPGVVIGDNVIIGAGSVVSKNLDSNSVYAGVPARKICTIDEYITKHASSIVHTKNMTQKQKEKWLRENRKELFLDKCETEKI